MRSPLENLKYSSGKAPAPDPVDTDVCHVQKLFIEACTHTHSHSSALLLSCLSAFIQRCLAGFGFLPRAREVVFDLQNLFHPERRGRKKFCKDFALRGGCSYESPLTLLLGGGFGGDCRGFPPAPPTSMLLQNIFRVGGGCLFQI